MNKTERQSELISATIYKCYHCAGVIGVTTNKFLIVGTVRFYKHVTFVCAVCEKSNFWKPSYENVKSF